MKINLTSTPDGFEETVRTILVELNRAIYRTRLNQGVPGAAGLPAELPADGVEFQVEILAKGTPTLTTTATKATPAHTITEVQVESGKETTQKQEQKTTGTSKTNSTGAVKNYRGGEDASTETLSYSEI